MSANGSSDRASFLWKTEDSRLTRSRHLRPRATAFRRAGSHRSKDTRIWRSLGDSRREGIIPTTYESGMLKCVKGSKYSWGLGIRTNICEDFVVKIPMQILKACRDVCRLMSFRRKWSARAATREETRAQFEGSSLTQFARYRSVHTRAIRSPSHRSRSQINAPFSASDFAIDDRSGQITRNHGTFTRESPVRKSVEAARARSRGSHFITAPNSAKVPRDDRNDRWVLSPQLSPRRETATLAKRTQIF